MPIVLTRGRPIEIQDFDSEIRTRLAQGSTDSFIYVVPTRRKIRRLQRDLLKAAASETAPAFPLYTLDMLASRVYLVCCKPKRVVAGAIQSVLFEKAIQECELNYFRSRIASPTGKPKLPRGTFQRLIKVINGLKEDGIYPETLQGEIQNAEMSEKAKLTDLYSIYSFYERELGAKFTDIGGIFRALNSALHLGNITSILRTAFPNVDLILLTGFSGFTKPETEFLNTLSMTEGVTTFISLDFARENDHLFGHLKENYDRLFKHGFVPTTLKKTESAQNETSLAECTKDNAQNDRGALKSEFAQHVQRYLFNRRPGETVRSSRFKENVTLVKAKNRSEEVEIIARIVKQTIAKNPLRDFSRICVATYRTEKYTTLMRETFSRYGIPVNITDRHPLSKSPFAISVIALLEIVQNNFRRRDVMRALISPYFRFAGENQGVDVSNLYAVSANLKILSGRTFWLERIERRLQAVDGRLRATDDDFEIEQLNDEKKNLEKAKLDIEHLWNLLKVLDERMTPKQFRHKMQVLLETLDVRRNMLNLRREVAGDDEIEKDIRAYSALQSLLDGLLELLEFQFIADKPQRLEFYIDQLKTAISESRYNIRQKFGYGVYVTAIEETRGLDFDIMILAGLVDSEFPSIYQPEVFLSKDLRKNETRHLSEERHLFYQGITNFTEHLYLVYPETDNELELVPSTFLDALLEIVEVDKDEDPGLKQAIFSEHELLQRYGKEYWERGHRDLSLPAGVAIKLKHIEHAVGVERSRLGQHDKLEYEGIITDRVTKNGRTALERFRDKVYSISQLETYGKCPFKFFANRVLRLRAFEEAEEGLTPIEKGNFYHEILFRFYTDRRNANKKPIRLCNHEEYRDALTELLTIARQKIEELDIRHPFWALDVEDMIGTPEEFPSLERRKGILQAFLESERKRNFIVDPAYFEVSFGERTGYRRNRDEQLSIDSPIKVGDITMRGKVDRVEVGEDVFTVSDYKTGKYIPKMKDISEGISLQIPIYLFAIEEVMRRRLGKEMKGVAGLYHLLRRKPLAKLCLGNTEYRNEAFNVGPRHQSLFDEAALRNIILRTIDFVKRYVEGITQGRFNLTEHDTIEVCPFCDYDRICRIKTLHWAEQGESSSKNDGTPVSNS
jgi:ATP-dependent helicase/DNAse subunit B